MPTQRFAALLLAGTALAACTTDTGVRTTPTFVAARRTPVVPAAARLLSPPLPPRVRARGVDAVADARADVLVGPTDLAMFGTTWVIDDADPRKVYVIPVAPLAPTTIQFPPGEQLTAKVAGSPDDFIQADATSGTRAVLTVMPNCAAPETRRFGPASPTPLELCRSARVPATFVTSGDIFHVEFRIYDYTAVAQVDFNRAPPPRTDADPVRFPPFPLGQAEPIYPTAVGEETPGWMPLGAFADSEKLVIRFANPLPTLPALFAGGEGEQVVNYSYVPGRDYTYLVTDRRVTEGQLRIDREVVAFTAGPVVPAAARPDGSKSKQVGPRHLLNPG